MSEEDEEEHDNAARRIAPLPRPARIGIVVLLLVLAVAHVIWPTLAIDAVFLGLLGLAAIVAFYDIEKISALGVVARRRAIRTASHELAALVDLPTIGTPSAPEVSVPLEGAHSLSLAYAASPLHVFTPSTDDR